MTNYLQPRNRNYTFRDIFLKGILEILNYHNQATRREKVVISLHSPNLRFKPRFKILLPNVFSLDLRPSILLNRSVEY